MTSGEIEVERVNSMQTQALEYAANSNVVQHHQQFGFMESCFDGSGVFLDANTPVRHDTRNSDTFVHLHQNQMNAIHLQSRNPFMGQEQQLMTRIGENEMDNQQQLQSSMVTRNLYPNGGVAFAQLNYSC